MSYTDSWGAVGTDPLADITDTPEHLIANLLADNYDEDITGIPFTSIRWEQWYESDAGDCAVYFQHGGEFDRSTELGWSAQDLIHYTDIHIFYRSLRQSYDGSADKVLWGFQKWIRKVLREQKTALLDKGIYLIEWRAYRMLLADPEVSDTKKLVVSVRSRMRMIYQSATATI